MCATAKVLRSLFNTGTVSVFGSSGCMYSAIACTTVFSEEREQLDVVQSQYGCELEVIAPYTELSI